MKINIAYAPDDKYINQNLRKKGGDVNEKNDIYC